MSDTLQTFMPTYDHRVVHAIGIPAPPEDVWAQMLAVTLAELPLPRLLMAIRTFPTRLRGGESALTARSQPLAELFRADNRWITLAQEPGHELVLGRVARFWQPVPTAPANVRTAEDLTAFQESGFAKAVISHEIIPEGTGSRLVTETRIQGTDPRVRRLFAAYWWLIRPGVGLIRRSALNAVARRCDHSV
ncbi:hypothetical protein AB0395_04610 [Streptosporangium sp. NPDC051023]|uniref:hypothetical protein n=1 Tax=Streptosporangium sp. NPDC051023 TaxID=3155410 RepID=UPI00344FFE91